MRRLRKVLDSFPMEMMKGAVKGQVLRVTNPSRYKYVRGLRPPRRELAKQKKQLISTLKQKLAENGMSDAKVFGRVKTLGSIDRKEKYLKTAFPESWKQVLEEDLLVLSVVTDSKEQCYKTVEVLKGWGGFPEIDYDRPVRTNPRDFFGHVEKKGGLPKLQDVIVANFHVEGFSPVHVLVFTKESYERTKANRWKYKTATKRTIKQGKK